MTEEDAFRIALPEPSLRLEQDQEWCLVETPEGWREIRFHDYSEIYDVPGLYERIFYDLLGCDSPATVRRVLDEQLQETDTAPSDLRVLDLGAGNGMVGEELAGLGVNTIVGVDITEAARGAAQRDRVGVYADYLVADMTNLSETQRRRLEDHRFNCLTCVAALGFGDIPPAAFAQAYRLVEREGLIAFNIKHSFVEGTDSSGFSRLIRAMIDEDILAVSCKTKYQHRLSTSGEPLEYTAFVGTKLREIPERLLG
jgi:predicted TPR repeat methyltransferase